MRLTAAFPISTLVRTSHLSDASPNRAPVFSFIFVSCILKPVLALSSLKFCFVSMRTIQCVSNFGDFDYIHGLPSFDCAAWRWL
jgi:hypothetical protein